MPFGINKLNLVAPTAIEYLPALSRELGIELYIKRDDLTSWGAGGNKLRKLEYLVADALAQGATMLLTVGGAQTNHGRLTAAVAAKYGLKCAIAAIDEYPGEVSANILLDRIMGCDLILKSDDGRDEKRKKERGKKSEVFEKCKPSRRERRAQEKAAKNSAPPAERKTKRQSMREDFLNWLGNAPEEN